MTATVHPFRKPERTVDDQLRASFRAEEALVAELARVRAQIAAQRLIYMASRGVYGLRVEAIRREVGA